MRENFVEQILTGGGGELPIATAVQVGDLVYVSGHIGALEDGTIPFGIEAQTRRALERIDRALAHFGCTLKDVFKATVWLADVRDFGAYNKVFLHAMQGNRIARSTVRADLMEDAKIEIEAIAYKPAGRAPDVSSREAAAD